MASIGAAGHAVQGQSCRPRIVSRGWPRQVPGFSSGRLRMAERCRIRRTGLVAELYAGYAPSNVARDAKYSIRHDLDGQMKVHLIYRSGHRERALLSTDLHRPLVNMVNDVKIEVQGAAGG